jgi:NADH-quinone oxidoreductase subunit L
MLIPMGMLGIGSLVAGFIPFGKFVTSDGQPLDTHLHLPVAVVSVSAALIGIATAWIFYKKPSPVPDKIVWSLGVLYQTVYRKFYIDEIYLFITKKLIFNLIARPLAWFDRQVIDGFMNFTATATQWISDELKGFQSGQLQKYAYIFLSGVMLIVLVILYSYK